jgi:tetratricopeptide (TPR) repeat protein
MFKVMSQLLKKYVPMLIVAVCSVVAGIVASAILFGGHPEPHSADETHLAEDQAGGHTEGTSTEHVATHVPGKSLGDGDTLAREDDIAGALEIYQQLAKKLPVDAPLEYRIGVCYEAVGKLDAAAARYQRAIDQSTNAVLSASARLGQARVLSTKRQFAAARAIYFELIGSPDRSATLAAEAYHRLASTLMEETFPDRDSMASASGLSVPEVRIDVGAMIALLGPAQPAPANDVPDRRQLAVNRVSDDPETMTMSIRVRDVPLSECIEQISALVQCEVRWRPETLRSTAKQVSVSLSDTSLSLVLDAVLEPQLMSWSFEQGVLTIRTATEQTPDRLHAIRQYQAKRMGRIAATLYPEHDLVVHTLLGLAKIETLANQLDAAVGYYQEIMRRFRKSHELRDAWFNLGKAFLAQGRAKDSRDAFYRAVDHGRGTPIEPVAYLYLGRLDIETLDWENASRQLVRSLSLAQDAEVRALSALLLAAVYLVEQNPQAGNNVLVDHRDLFTADEFRNKAAFLSALAGFRATSDDTEKARRGRILTNSVPQLQGMRHDSLVWSWIIGSAFLELGFPNQTTRVYDEAIKGVRPSGLRHAMALGLANELIDAGDIIRAEEVLRSVAAADDEVWSRQAITRLAVLKLKARKHGDCLTLCYELLQSSTDATEKKELLRLMGRAYEEQADHYSAALCFAGLVPTENQPIWNDPRP